MGGPKKMIFSPAYRAMSENGRRMYLDVDPDGILIPKCMESRRQEDRVLNRVYFTWTKKGFGSIRIRDELI